MPVPQLSSEISAALRRGDIPALNHLWGSAYAVHGIVVHGNHLGQQIGFPTANIELAPESPPLPGNGVYAVTVSINNIMYSGMANIGFRPTVKGQHLTFEVHLIRFSGTLYDSPLRVSFYSRLRDEKKFADLNALIDQLQKDLKQVSDLFS
jgi:riboflavin kinase/FMN adenylyltransferase